MKRRDFMRMTATASGMLLCGGTRLALGQQAAGPYWLFIEASGGWDPTSFCDPKGGAVASFPSNPGETNTYDASDIGQAGNIRFAPKPALWDAAAAQTPEPSLNFHNADFFNAHFQRLVVVNGINYGTNSHEVGRTASWTGTRSQNYPAAAALIASELAGDYSMPFIASRSSESSKTNGIVPRTIVSGGDLNAIREIALPNRANTSQATQYHSDNMRSLIENAAATRRQRQLTNQRLLRLRNALAGHDASRNRDARSLSDFVNNLNSQSSPNGYVNSRNNARNLFNKAQTAFAAFEAGAAMTAQIDIGGFDTHDDHDRRHYPRLMDYLAAVDNIIDDAMMRGFGDNLIIVMGSDFGRTNKFNNDNGKDHWSHTSMMFWGASALINGNRVVGATDGVQRSRRVDPATLAIDDNNGIELTPEYVHQSIRQLAGIDMNPTVSSNYPFSQNALPIFV